MLGDNIVDSDIMRLGGYVFNKLEAIANANRDSASLFEQSVIIAFAAAYTIAVTVKGNARHDYHFDLRNIYRIVTFGLFDMERTQRKVRTIVG